jgi:hypothetical protein
MREIANGMGQTTALLPRPQRCRGTGAPPERPRPGGAFYWIDRTGKFFVGSRPPLTHWQLNLDAGLAPTHWPVGTDKHAARSRSSPTCRDYGTVGQKFCRCAAGDHYPDRSRLRCCSQKRSSWWRSACALSALRSLTLWLAPAAVVEVDSRVAVPRIRRIQRIARAIRQS